MKMTTYYFRVCFGYTESDIKKMRDAYYAQGTDGGMFVPPETELVLHVECDNLTNPFQKVCEILQSPLFAINYDVDIEPEVTIKDCTNEILLELEKREDDFQDALAEFLQ